MLNGSVRLNYICLYMMYLLKKSVILNNKSQKYQINLPEIC